MSESENSKVLVWDISIRLFHWLIVLLFLFQWFSIEVMDDWMQYHEIGGYAMLTLLVFRLIWGIVGSKYARFSQFLYSPRHIIDYSRTFFSSNSSAYPGHNPMGGISVIIILTLLFVQAISGLFMTDDILFYAPYFSSVSEETQKLMSRLHHLSFDILIWMIGLHLLAIFYYVQVKKQPLIKAMVHGYKVIKGYDSIKGNYMLRAIIVLIIALLCVYGVVVYFAPESVDYF